MNMDRCEKIVREFVKDNNYQLLVKIVDPDYPIWEGSIKNKDKLILLIQHIPTNEAYVEEDLFKELEEDTPKSLANICKYFSANT